MGSVKVFADGSLEALTTTALLRFALQNDSVMTSCEPDPSDVDDFFQHMKHTLFDTVVLIGNVFTSEMYTSLLEATKDNVKLIVLTDDIAYTTEPESQGWVYYCDNRTATQRVRGAKGYTETMMEMLPGEFMEQYSKEATRLGGGPSELEKILRGSTPWKLRVLNAIYETLDTSSYITWLSDRLAAVRQDYQEPLFDNFSEMFADRFLRYQDEMNNAGVQSAHELLPGIVVCTLLTEDTSCFQKLATKYPRVKILITVLSTAKCYMLTATPTETATRLTVNKKEIWVEEVDLDTSSGNSTAQSKGAD